MSELRRYGTLLADGVAGSAPVSLSLRAAGLGTFAAAVTWAAGDVRVSKDGGALANIAVLPVYSNGQWKFFLSAAELTARVVFVLITNAAIDSESFTVETLGHASAMWPDNWAAQLLPAALVGGKMDSALSAGERDAAADALLARPLPEVPEVDTAGEALLAARAQAFGRWDITGDVLTLYASDGIEVVKAFNLTPSGGAEGYTARTAV